jgi:hypothetical protein
MKKEKKVVAMDNYNNDGYEENYYDPYKDNIKKDPIVKIKKKLFACINIQDPTDGSFSCFESSEFPAGPDSGQYIECTEESCPLIDESDSGAQIFKDVATVHDLSPQGTPINLDKFHYSVTEGDINQIITGDKYCEASGFRHGAQHHAFTQDFIVEYDICVKYVEDCDGTIYPGQVKTCTIENYISNGFIRDINGATTATTNQTSNVGVPNTLSFPSFPR